MSENKVTSLTPDSGTSVVGYSKVEYGTVTHTVLGQTVQVSMGTLRNSDGSDAMAGISTGMSAISNLDTKINLGQKTMANSVPVVLSSDQNTLPVSLASIPLASGAATETTLSAINLKIPTTLGQKLKDESFSVVIATNQTPLPIEGGNADAVKVDGSAVTQPISATALPLPTGAATSALQTTGNTSLSNIDTKLPATLGQKSSTASLPVVIASDQSALPSNLTQLAGVTLDSAGVPTRSHDDYELAGRVFNATTNPTPLTGTVLHAVTAGYVNTAPSILIVAGSKPVTLKEILLKCTVAGAGGTTYQVIGVMDSVARYTSGGTLRSAKNNAFTDSTATLRVGTVAIVAAAPSASARVVFNPTIIKAAAPAVNDMYKLVFGQPECINSVGNSISSLPPVTIPANGSLALHFISAVAWTTIPQFEGTIIFQE